jgi:hypothetical protein
MSKFKKGDVVVCISEFESERTFSSLSKIGDTFVVARVFVGTISRTSKFETTDRKNFPQEHFELYEVYHSPLYQALL